MKRSAERILVTHVGSLVRPPAIREVMAAREQDLPYDHAAFQKTLREEVANVVRQQAQAGVDIREHSHVERLSALAAEQVIVAVRPRKLVVATGCDIYISTTLWSSAGRLSRRFE
jgi:hypothetical protein